MTNKLYQQKYRLRFYEIIEYILKQDFFFCAYYSLSQLNNLIIWYDMSSH